MYRSKCIGRNANRYVTIGFPTFACVSLFLFSSIYRLFWFQFGIVHTMVMEMVIGDGQRRTKKCNSFATVNEPICGRTQWHTLGNSLFSERPPVTSVCHTLYGHLSTLRFSILELFGDALRVGQHWNEHSGLENETKSICRVVGCGLFLRVFALNLRFKFKL